MKLLHCSCFPLPTSSVSLREVQTIQSKDYHSIRTTGLHIKSFTVSSGLNFLLTAVMWYKCHSAMSILQEFPATFVLFLTGTAARNITIRILPTPHPQPLPQSPCNLQQLFIRKDHSTVCRNWDAPMHTLITLQQILLQRILPLNAKFYCPCKSLRGFSPDHVR